MNAFVQRAAAAELDALLEDQGSDPKKDPFGIGRMMQLLKRIHVGARYG